jgi:NTE family protein
MKLFCFYSLLILFFLFSDLNAFSQRVGVVLSGGGARGVAHIGVLKALEENEIPIDYITGTSMGAIIGGMYASGLSPDSIEKIVTSPDFKYWASGTIQEEYLYYYSNPTPNASWISLRFRIDSIWQHRLPTNLISPVQMDFAGLQYFTAVNVPSKGDFDKLFIPFRCVAADIHGKRPVVFKSGELFPAIRASMTYPFVFRPIRIDGTLLFDGGIYNNFPVDVMISDFNPDVIIGSVVSANFPPPQEDDIRSHIENMLVYHTDYDVPAEKGLVVRPQIPPTNVTDFSQSIAFVDSGYVATIRMLDDIKDRVRRSVSKEDIFKRRESFFEQIPPLIIDQIFIKGVNEAQREFISRILLDQEKPTPIEEIKPFYFRLMAKEHIQSIMPSALFNPQTGYYDLYLDVVLNRDLMLQFGGNVSSSPVNFAFLEVQYHYLDYQAYEVSASTYFSRFYSAFQLKGRMDLAFQVPIFVKTVGSFNFYDYFKSATTFFQDQEPSYILKNQNFWELQAGIPVRNDGKLILGFTAGRNRDDYYQTNMFRRADIADRTIFRYASPNIQFERNTLNRKQFPSSGSRVFVSGRYVSGSEQHRPGTTSPNMTGLRANQDYLQLRSSYLNYFTKVNEITLGLFTEVLLSNKKLFSNYTSSLLAAETFDQVPEMRTLFLPNYRANSFAVAGLQGIYSFTPNIDLRVESYLFQPYRQIHAGSDNTALYGKILSNRYLLLSAAVVANTPVGPISLGINFYDRNENPFSFAFNFGYLIFNPRPLR